MSNVRFLPRDAANNLEAMLIESRVAEAVLSSEQPLKYRELAARQLRRIYRARLVAPDHEFQQDNHRGTNQ